VRHARLHRSGDVEKTFLDVTTRRLGQHRKPHVEGAREAGPGGVEAEKRYVRKDGRVLWVTLAVALVRDDRGRPQYFVSAIQDVTERKRRGGALPPRARGGAPPGRRRQREATLQAVISEICESENWEVGPLLARG